jgi:hypothetical protein
MKDRALPIVTLQPPTRIPVKLRTNKKASNELFLEWLENKEYIRSEFLLHDKKYMEDTVNAFKRRTTDTPGAVPIELDEAEDCDDDEEANGYVTDHQSVEAAPTDEDVSGCENSSQISHLSVENAKPLPLPSQSSCETETKEQTLDESAEKQTGNDNESTEQPVDDKSTEKQTANKSTTQTVKEAKEPAVNESDDLDREMLLKQLDILRMRFKQAKIPENTESLQIPDIRRIVNRNVAQLKRNRNVATYKLGMVAVLLVMELFFARVCKVDVSRFMQWHYSNMQSYEEILVELGEVSSPITEASPMTQLCLLMFFNSALFVGNELMLKYFQVDVLNVMSSITGAQLPPQTAQQPSQNPPPSPKSSPPPPFAANFSRFL